MSSVSLNNKAIQLAKEEGYIDGYPLSRSDYSAGSSSSYYHHHHYCCWNCCSGGGGGGGSGKDAAAVALAAVCLAVVFSGVIGATASSVGANEARLRANECNKDEEKAKKDKFQKAEKIFGIVSTEKRIEAVSFGVMATGCSLLVMAALGKLIVYNYPDLFDQTYLIYAAAAGGAFLALGGLTYFASHYYKDKKKEEVQLLVKSLEQPAPSTTPSETGGTVAQTESDA